jgi:hypothetical protein
MGHERYANVLRARHPFCEEFEVFEKTVEVVVRVNDEPVKIRIAAYKSESETVGYTTRCQVLDDPEGKYKYWNFPWTARDNADDAIHQELSFLGDTVRARTAASPK